MTNSIKTELVPWAVDHVDNKNFTWTITSISEDKVAFDFIFENPLFISQGEKPDTMSITFLNTPLYLIPQDTNKKSIPNGFKITIKLPP